MATPREERGGARSSGTSSADERALKTLLVSDLVDSTARVDRLGDERAADVFRQHDRQARDLLRIHGGLEIDKTDGFLLLFERPLEAVLYAIAFHRALRELSQKLGLALATRIGIHVGEVHLVRNCSEDVAHGAKPLEVEGLAKPFTARIMSLALGGQTLLTRTAFDLARRSAVGQSAAEGLQWLSHGRYCLKGVEDAVDVHEVGVQGEAPLRAPDDSPKAHRLVESSQESGPPSPGRRSRPATSWVRRSVASAWCVVLALADEDAAREAPRRGQAVAPEDGMLTDTG